MTSSWFAIHFRIYQAQRFGLLLLYTVHNTLIAKAVGRLSLRDGRQLERSLREWLGFS
jgi:hypothetical protein